MPRQASVLRINQILAAAPPGGARGRSETAGQRSVTDTAILIQLNMRGARAARRPQSATTLTETSLILLKISSRAPLPPLPMRPVSRPRIRWPSATVVPSAPEILSPQPSHLGFGRIVASEIEAPNLLMNLV